MTDYNELSDFEINKRVGKLTGLAKGNEPVLQVVLTSTGSKFDPCNYPHQAYPIIVENLISIEFDDDGYDTPQSAWCRAKTPSGEEYYGNVREPLRAAMIVFLKMNECK